MTIQVRTSKVLQAFFIGLLRFHMANPTGQVSSLHALSIGGLQISSNIFELKFNH